MSRPWYGTAYLRWIQPLHDKGRVPFCWDCRLLRQARAADEFYAHDEPVWYFDELMANAEPAVLVTERPYVSRLWAEDWDSEEDSVYDDDSRRDT